MDMDGVLTDFVGGLCKLFDRESVDIKSYDGVCEAFGVTERELWWVVSNAGQAFWRDLKPYPWAMDLMNVATSVAPVFICSTPTLDPACAAGKMQWLDHHLSIPFGSSLHPRTFYRDYIFTPHKHLLANPNALLIDDSPGKCHKFLDAGGRAILFPQPYNFKGDLDVLRGSIIEHLKGEAYERGKFDLYDP